MLNKDSEIILTWFVDVDEHKDGTIVLPFENDYVDNFVSAFVDWGDGTESFIEDKTLSHKYDYSGLYEIKVKNIDCNAVSNQKNLSGLLMVNGLESLGVSDFSGAFRGAYDLFYVSGIPSGVNNMSYMFERAYSFNQNINDWDTSKVTHMNGMFHSAINFNQPLNSWNVSNVQNMWATFLWAKSFNQSLNKWNVSNVINMGSMFLGATEFNQDINNWNVNKRVRVIEMFDSCGISESSLPDWYDEKLEV